MATRIKSTDGKGKRKRVVLTLDQKLEILKLLKKSVSYSIICDKFGIGRSTVGDIKKNREKILQFKKDTVEMGMRRDQKTMKLGGNAKLDKALYVWFSQKRVEGVPVSGPMLCEKARVLHKELDIEGPFVASEGWKWRFCKRHGIRNLSLVGEKLSADNSAADEFVSSFAKWVTAEKLCPDRIFNCDETGLNFRLLPEKTLAASFEKSADGRKKSKDRVTLNLCSNASGSIKLKLHLIGKAQKPRCFKSLNVDTLPVKYSGQKNAWMTASIFLDWFHGTFVPNVRLELKKLGLEPRAVLILDNCSAHPDSDLLVSTCGKITAKFLPANVTSLIQPMDQGVIEALKLRYKKKLLRKLLIEDDRGIPVIDFVRSIDMQQVAYLVAEAWDEIAPHTLRKSWRKILPLCGLPPEEILAITAAHSQQSATVSRILGSLFEEANQNDDFFTLKQADLQETTEHSHAYIQGVRFKPKHEPIHKTPSSAATKLMVKNLLH